MKIQFVLLVSLALIVLSSAKKFGKCELAKELYHAGFSKSSLPDWICLVQAESNFDSSVVGGPNTDGSYDWGLFQINDRYWCKNGYAGGECRIDCNDLVDNYIVDDIKCVKKIFNTHGFDAWYGWINRCRGKQLPSVHECF